MEEFIEYNRENVLKTYEEMGDALKARNTENTEKFRKGSFTLKFQSEGDRRIRIKQIKHSFLFGSTAFMLGSFEDDPSKESVFKEKFAGICNQAVVPFYWSDLEPEEGKLRFDKNSEYIYRRPTPDSVLEFCSEYGLEPKGHCLLWHISLPGWLSKYSPEVRKRLVEKRFREISERYADKIPSFDIVNESCSFQPKADKVLFPDSEEYALELGNKYFPNNRKILNETNEAIWYSYFRTGKYMPFNMQLKDFIRRGLPFDEIGIQYHIFAKEQDLMKVGGDRFASPYRSFIDASSMMGVLDMLDAYNKPMHISEITIPSYWGGNAVHEDAQAALTEILYRIWFATPNMKSIVWWNLVDGYAAYAPHGVGVGENKYGGGLLRYDLSEKPAYKVLDKLINNEWHTEIDDKCSGTDYSFRGFYGDYVIETEEESGHRTHRVSFDSDGCEVLVNTEE
ncbi:MAG: endo-1,4-beta-xylanase [Clostridia bacterium]|nr:endo-1,4-beta-xylanase [Clostridia bacterium]